jgi:hypothetical protein
MTATGRSLPNISPAVSLEEIGRAAGNRTVRARLRDAAERLVRLEWGQHRIRLIAAALLRHGTLSGEAICGLTSQTANPA